MKIWGKRDSDKEIDELVYMLWQSEVNKELAAFWKSISK